MDDYFSLAGGAVEALVLGSGLAEKQGRRATTDPPASAKDESNNGSTGFGEGWQQKSNRNGNDQHKHNGNNHSDNCWLNSAGSLCSGGF